MFNRRLLSAGLIAVFTLVASLKAQDLGEKILYRKASPYTTILVTEDAQGFRTLAFDKGDVRQSVVKPGDPDIIELEYARVMPVGLAFVEKPQRALMIGLGGGTIPNFLRKHWPELTIDIVDIDPDVVRVAKEYFGFREDSRMRVYVDDGRRFIERCRTPYDLILLDAFGPENTPYALTTREFLQGVRRALTPQGAVVANLFSRDWNALYDSMVRTYQEVFDDIYVFDVENAGNNILVALPRREPITRDGLAARAGRISKQRTLPFDLAGFVRYGFRHPAEKDPRGRILLDRDAARKAG